MISSSKCLLMLILSIKLISNLLFDVDVSGNGFDMSRQLMKFINWGCGAFIDDTGVYKMIIFCKYGVGSGKGGGGGGGSRGCKPRITKWTEWIAFWVLWFSFRPALILSLIVKKKN